MRKVQSSPSPIEPPSNGPLPPEYLQCLQRALALREAAPSYAQLMGISGEAFRVFFSGRDPALGASVVVHNPLRAVAVALGFECTVQSADDVDSALDLLATDLGEGHGPALLCTEQGWLAVESCSDVAPRRWSCWRPEQGPVDLLGESLAAYWSPTPGLLELGPLSRHFFSLGERVRVSEPREAALAAMQRAHRLTLRQSKVAECFGGLNAYREISAVLGRRRRASQSAHDLSTYATWHAIALPQLIESRTAAALFLREAAHLFPDDEEQECLFRAYQAYRRLAAAMAALPTFAEEAVRVLQMPMTTALDESRKAGLVRSLWWERRRIQQGVKLLWRLERAAAEALQRVVQASERKGRS